MIPSALWDKSVWKFIFGLITLSITPHFLQMSRIISRICNVGVAAHENPQLEIDPSYDDVEEDQPIDRTHDLEDVVFGGYAAQKIAKDRLVGEEALAGSLGGFDLAIYDCFIFRYGTSPSNGLRIRVTLNPFLDPAQDGAHLAHDPRVDRSEKTIVAFTRPTNDWSSLVLNGEPDGKFWQTGLISCAIAISVT